ncbi:MAG: xylose isomerase domain-containing protein [Armatimonadetes bacterium CSP1-3]|nr:MAG: xylose isomerase domain-containing protein [Armatimonadetes bacterium CSP1-3]
MTGAAGPAGAAPVPERKPSIALSATRAGFGPLLCAGDLERGLRLAAEVGFAAVEISVRDPADLGVRRLEKLLSALGLQLSAVATGQSFYTDGLNLCDREAEIRVRAVERFKACTDFAARFGGAVILGGIRGLQACSREEALEAFRQCVAHAGGRGVTVCIEPINRYETDFLNTIAEVTALIGELNAGPVRILPDTFHMNIEEPVIEDSLRRAGALIGYVHLADSNRRAPGGGHIDFAAVRAALDAVGYAGYVGFEILPVPDDETAVRQAWSHWSDYWAHRERGRR